MSGLLREEKDMAVLSLNVKVPRHLLLGISESLEDGMAKAVQILVESTAFEDLFDSADNLARLINT